MRLIGFSHYTLYFIVEFGSYSFNNMLPEF